MYLKNSLLLLLTYAAMVMSVQAQRGKVISAWKYLNDYSSSKDTVLLVKAKEAIDMAITNPETKEEAKTWFYRGEIYQAAFDKRLQLENEKVKDETDPGKKSAIAYRNAGRAELDLASQSYVKAKELDTKNNFGKDILQKLGECSRHYENIGISLYGAKQLTDALPAFEKALEINTLLGETDTTNINNSALVSVKIKNYEKARIYYQKLIDLKYGKGSTYAVFSNVLLSLNDTLGASEIVGKGRLVYPDDINLLITQTNFFLRDKKTDEAIKNLNLAIQKDPNDVNLYLVLGNLYDNMANPKDSKGKDGGKPKNYEELFKLAGENYKKSIELKPDYFDALYNLGILYNNHGVTISKNANAEKITDAAKYAAENKEADEEFQKALPYLEKALDVNPKDKNTMIALKQLYSRTKQMEKLNKINEMLKN